MKMGEDFLQFILETQKIDFALFNRSLRLIEWSEGVRSCLPKENQLQAGLHISEIFLELQDYEDLLMAVVDGRHPRLAMERIEKPPRQDVPPPLIERFAEYYSINAHAYQDGLLVVLRDVTEEGVLEQDFVQQRNELDLMNYRLIDELKAANEELNQAYVTTLTGWAKALELRDAETKGHSQRVVELTRLLARAAGVPEKDLKYYGYGALLHDIGKMGVPDAILRKPEPLLAAEQKIMMRHPVYAYQLLKPIKYLHKSLDIPHFHHERWDGSGYPEGLKGEAIPISARIFAIVDVYDALISKRPYRKAWNSDKALIHIREQSGTHFDPGLVEIFIRIMSEAG